MKKTKLEIMKDIKEFAKDDEVTPSFIRKYLIEILGLGRASAYRFLQKSDSDFIVFTQKKYEKKDSIDYTNEEFEEITLSTFEIMHKNNKSTLSTITLQEIEEIAEKVGTTPRFLCLNILGIDAKKFDKLMSGELKTAKIILGLGYKDDKMAKKVKDVKHKLIQEQQGKKFSLDEIIELSNRENIPVEIMLKKILDLSNAQITRLYKDTNIKFTSRREFIDYPYNEEIEPSSIYKKHQEVVEEEFNQHIFLDEEDEKDCIYEEDDFYIINASTQEEFINELNKKVDFLKKKRTALIEKYDEKYIELVESFKELNIDFNNTIRSNSNLNKILDIYISQLKKIISRNPKYYEYYPPKLRIEDFKKIATDLGIDEKLLAYRMFKDSHYDRKEKNENAYYEIECKKMPQASNFYILFQKELEQGIGKIVYRTVSDYKGRIGDVADDIFQLLRIEVINKGVQMLFYGKDCETKEEYIAKVFPYLKAKCKSLCEKELQRTALSLDASIKEDSGSKFENFVADPHGEDFIEPEEPEESDESTIKNILEGFNEEDSKIIMTMYNLISKTGNRVQALKILALRMGISVDELNKTLGQIYERG